MIQENGELGKSLTAAFWGLVVPGAEWLVPSFKNRALPIEKRNPWVERHVRFQRNWFLLRLLVLLVAGSWAAQLTYAPKAKHVLPKNESEFSIPGETSEESSGAAGAEQSNSHRSQTFQFSRKFENGNEDIEIRREFINLADPNSILIAIVGIFVAIFLWSTSMMITLVNVFRVSAAKVPFFPLTLKKKADRSQP